MPWDNHAEKSSISISTSKSGLNNLDSYMAVATKIATVMIRVEVLEVPNTHLLRSSQCSMS